MNDKKSAKAKSKKVAGEGLGTGSQILAQRAPREYVSLFGRIPLEFREHLADRGAMLGMRRNAAAVPYLRILIAKDMDQCQKPTTRTARKITGEGAN
jgi:hypothetical protein